jgi:hypothetical protein
MSENLSFDVSLSAKGVANLAEMFVKMISHSLSAMITTTAPH